MAQRSHVPKFGNWESEEVPYTVYFDKARKGRTGGNINPNDPQENPEAFPDNNGSPARAPPPTRPRTEKEKEEPIVRRPVHERRTSREDVDFVDSPARHENVGRKSGNDRRPGDPQRKPVRAVGSGHSMDKSPLHPQVQARIANKGSNSPIHSNDSLHGTPTRTRMKPHSRDDDIRDKGAAVPKFGEWDESNPASADGFTHIFNKVREERQTGAARVPGMGVEAPYKTDRAQNNNKKAKGCCFPWSRK